MDMAFRWLVAASVAGLCVSGCGLGDDGSGGGGLVTVTITDAGAPQQNLGVIFHNADGSVLEYVMTDAAGIAARDVPKGGMFTITSDDGAGNRSLSTTADLRGGWTFDIELTDPPTTTGTIDVTLPGDFVGATDYEIDGGCGGTSSTTSGTDTLAVDIDSSDCVATTALSILAWATDGNNNDALVAYAVGSGDVGGAVTLGAWLTDFATLDFTVDNPPPGVLAGGGGAGLAIGEQSYDLPGAPGGQTFPVTGSMLIPQSSGADGFSYSALAAYGAGQSLDALGFYQRTLTAMPTTATIDMTADVLPYPVGGVSLDTSADPARPTFSWTPDDAGMLANADFQMLTYGYTTTADSYNWTIQSGPRGNGEFIVPALPDDLSDWRADTSTVFAGEGLFAGETSFLGGWTDLAGNFDDIVPPLESEITVVLPFSFGGP